MQRLMRLRYHCDCAIGAKQVNAWSRDGINASVDAMVDATVQLIWLIGRSFDGSVDPVLNDMVDAAAIDAINEVKTHLLYP